MKTLRALWNYWKESFGTSKELREKMSGYLAAAVFVGLFLLGWFRVPLPRVQAFLDSYAAMWIEAITGAYSVLCLFVWLPFKRHQDQEGQHADEIEQREAEIAAFKERDRPKIKVACDDSDRCHTNKGGMPQYFRLAVTLDWNQPATGCFGKLTRIEKDGQVVRDHDVDQLPFARSHDTDALSKKLVPTVTEFLDVLAVSVLGVMPPSVFASAAGGRVTMLRNASQQDVFQAAGDYTLTVTVCGDKIPHQTYRLLFKWTGAGDTSSLSLL